VLSRSTVCSVAIAMAATDRQKCDQTGLENAA